MPTPTRRLTPPKSAARFRAVSGDWPTALCSRPPCEAARSVARVLVGFFVPSLFRAGGREAGQGEDVTQETIRAEYERITAELKQAQYAMRLVVGKMDALQYVCDHPNKKCWTDYGGGSSSRCDDCGKTE